MQNPVDAFSEEMYQSIRKSRGKTRRKSGHHAGGILRTTRSPRRTARSNRLSKDSNPKVAAFAAAIAGELRCFIKDLLDELTS